MMTSTMESAVERAQAVAFLTETARYFESRPTGGEDRAHWANVANAENCRSIAKLLATQPATPAASEVTDAMVEAGRVAALEAFEESCRQRGWTPGRDTPEIQEIVRIEVRAALEAAFASTRGGQGMGEGLPCERCQGNGEIVTDWERYRHPHDGDVGEEAVCECSDCSGTGRVSMCRGHEMREREAFRTGWKLNAVSNEIHNQDYLDGCEEVDWQEYQKTRTTPPSDPSAREALAAFAREVIRSSVFESGDLDGGDVQELGVKYGLLNEVAYDPAVHGSYDGDPDDPYFVFSQTLCPAPVPAASAQPEGATR